ncbi:MAG: methyltransferase domain-containing protein [Fervidicoccaceae archaeon]
MVISTEILEHVQDWRKAVYNMKDVLKKGGYIYNNA